LKTPKIVILYNESPDWPDDDKAWTARMTENLARALAQAGYAYQAIKYFDSLAELERYDPGEWLVWNWGEEIGGQPWTDAVVAAELEQRGFTYTGSSAATLAFTCDRVRVKQRLQAAGLPTLPARLFTAPPAPGEWDLFPAIVKGANQHGSFGIEHDSVVADSDELARRIRYMREHYHDDSLVEPFLDTREFHVAVFGNGKLEALPPAEYDYSSFSDMRDRLFTYSWKYDENSWGYHAVKVVAPSPADDGPLRRKLEQVAMEAYRVLSVSDYGRVDMRLLGDEPQILDVNTNPDIDVASAFAVSASAHGLSYRDMIERIIGYAVARMGNSHPGSSPPAGRFADRPDGEAGLPGATGAG
jgi:D-alanine-D-alanine ligase